MLTLSLRAQCEQALSIERALSVSGSTNCIGGVALNSACNMKFCGITLQVVLQECDIPEICCRWFYKSVTSLRTLNLWFYVAGDLTRV